MTQCKCASGDWVCTAPASTYEVLPGNTSEKTTPEDFPAKIEAQYSQANRVWVMERGIPTEAVLAKMSAAKTPVHY